jgi:hypothetical protein
VIGTNDAMTNLEAVKAVALRHSGSTSTAFPRLSIRTLDRPTDFAGLTYVPVVCLVLQGAKRTVIGDQVLDYGAGSCMVVAAEVVAIGQISEASPEAPYLAVNLYLDPAVISALLLEMSDMPEPPILRNAGCGGSRAAEHAGGSGADRRYAPAVRYCGRREPRAVRGDFLVELRGFELIAIAAYGQLYHRP